MKNLVTFFTIASLMLSVQAQVRIVAVDPIANEFTLQNFGGSSIDVSSYRFCSLFTYTPNLSSLERLQGVLILAPGQSVRLAGFDVNDDAADLGLYRATGSFADPNAMIDFLQWGSNGNGRESVAVTKGIWEAGDFIDVAAPFSYIGDGTENGSDFWNTTPEQMTFEGILTGTQEVLPISTQAYGNIEATLLGNTLVVTGNFKNLAGDFDANIAGGSHIHKAIAGRNGGIELFLTPQLSSDLRSGSFIASENTFELTDEQLAALKNRMFYVNIHTKAFASGELRAQLLPAASQYMNAILAGSNEVPSIISAASGNVLFELEGDKLIASGSFDNLEGKVNFAAAGGAHIHKAITGRNGGIELFINFEIDGDSTGAIILPDSNTFTLSPDQLALLSNEELYVNIHSMAFPAGELRGQVSPVSVASFRAAMAGSQEVPVPVNTDADGRILINYDGKGAISVSGSFNNLSDDLNVDLVGGAHIHLGIAGTNGGIVVPINVSADDARNGVFLPGDNTFDLTEEQVYALFARKLYVNIHSNTFVPGELRGQILPFAQAYFGTTLSSRNEVPARQSPAFGSMQFELSGNKLTATGSFADLIGDFNSNIAGGAHIHLANAANNGGISVLLNTLIDADLKGGEYLADSNMFDLDSTQIAALKGGEFYVNIHSTEFGPGEIRGQILRDDNRFPTASTIESPAQNASLTVSSDNQDPFVATWTAATDPDGDLVVYTWQLSATADFAELIVDAKVGTATQFETSIAVVDTLLDNAGVPVGGSITLYHRAISSDGAVSTTGEAYAVNLSRGEASLVEIIALELECPDYLGERFKVAEDPDASNGKVISPVGGETFLNTPPTDMKFRVSYKINVTQGGTYYANFRLRGPSASTNSVWVRLDDGSSAINKGNLNRDIMFKSFPISNDLVWLELFDRRQGSIATPFDLEPGTYTLTLAYREPGALFDKVILSNSDIDIEGFGPKAYNCEMPETMSSRNAIADVYPNPSTGSFTVTLRGQIGEEMKLQLLSMNGQIIDLGVHTLGSVEERISFDLNANQVSNGLYLLQVVSENVNVNAKVMFQR